jgi:predicted O-methyltransferase YrrM
LLETSNIMKYITFDSLCQSMNKDKIQIKIIHHANKKHIGIHVSTRVFPISINESEFNFMLNFVVNNNLKNGFELSTGTGISTIALGTALKETNGHLITIDSYYEELHGISSNIPVGNYLSKDIEKIKETSLCYKFATSAIATMGLSDHVGFEIGWSPVDSVAAIQKRNTPMDLVFLDCPKNDAEFERDIRSIRPFMDMNKFAIFVHDTDSYTQKSFDLVKELFNTEMIQIYEYFKNTPHYAKQHFPIAIISNIKI